MAPEPGLCTCTWQKEDTAGPNFNPNVKLKTVRQHKTEVKGQKNHLNHMKHTTAPWKM